MAEPTSATDSAAELKVRRMHRRDINRAWEFLKRVFRDVHAQTVEYQRPRSKARFQEQYDEEGVEQLLFEVGGDIVGYAECSFEVLGDDNWINPRYFDNRDMRPMFIEELATHPDYQGRGVGSFMIEQLMHLARVRGCTHLVLEVAENNEGALSFYRKRQFYKLDASIFLAKRIPVEPELLPPRRLPQRRRREEVKGRKRGDAASTSKNGAGKAEAKGRAVKPTSTKKSRTASTETDADASKSKPTRRPRNGKRT
jgi:ribosomal protein S18 acetylase RimI-like enzyme